MYKDFNSIIIQNSESLEVTSIPSNRRIFSLLKSLVLSIPQNTMPALKIMWLKTFNNLEKNSP